MASLDDRVEKAQDRIVHFFINNEQYINEYVTIPLFYESLFHSKSYINYRCFILSLLMLRQIFQKVNKKLMVFEYIYLLTPFFAYIALENKYTATALYSLIYSTNQFESVFLGLTTGYFASSWSFEAAYIFHVCYVLFRNNVIIAIEPIPNTHQTTLHTKIINYIPPTFSERVAQVQESMNTFINTQLEPIIETHMYR